MNHPALCLLLMCGVALLTSCTNGPAVLSYNDLPEITKRTGNHIVHFSNKAGSFWAGETRRTQDHWSTGFVSHRERLFGDTGFEVDGLPLQRGGESQAVYSPVSLKRGYDNSIQETVFMPDSIDGLGIILNGPLRMPIRFHLQDVASKGDAAVSALDTLGAVVAVWELQGPVTTHIAVATDAAAALPLLGEGGRGFDLEIQGQLRTEYAFGVGVGGSSEEAVANAAAIVTRRYDLIDEKRARLSELLAGRPFESGDPRLNQAWLWALSSFDALSMNEVKTGLGRGIYAGYPWFQDYWGRDSFIALRALTVTGQFELAAANLESFLAYQILADTSADYGKIPNRVRPNESIYNTADATPRFLIEADRYVAYSGDSAFAARIVPHLVAAVEGTAKHRLDGNGLLLHNDADTWMDAVGPRGPYSPRGDRANDIQALWIDGLQAVSNLAAYADAARGAALKARADSLRTKALEAFLRQFLVPSQTRGDSAAWIMADALRPDGRPSLQSRPNVFFAYHLVPDPAVKASIARQATARLGTPWGVLSLAADDAWFHPYHKTEPLYEQDASYHNGIVWLWNSGAWVEALVRHGLHEQANEVAMNYVDLMLENVALGTLPELIDAMPRTGFFVDQYPDSQHFGGISRIDQMSLRNEALVDARIPAVSGTWSQAWSLSEWIRNVAEDFAGLRYDVGHGFSLQPAVPVSWGDVRLVRQFAGYVLTAALTREGEGHRWTFHVAGSPQARPFPLPFKLPEMEGAVLLDLVPGDVRYEVLSDSSGVRFLKDGEAFTPARGPAPSWVDVTRGGTDRWPLWNSAEYDPGAAAFRSQLGH